MTVNTSKWRERAELCRQMASVVLFPDLAMRWRIAAGEWDHYADRVDEAVAELAALKTKAA